MTSILDPVLFPFLLLNPTLAIVLLSFLIALMITTIYKYTTNQTLMKQLKDEITELQQETKTLKDNPSAALEVQKRAMETNMKYMMQSMRATIFTILPMIFIFGWLSSHYAFLPIEPGREFGIVATFESDGSEIGLRVPDGVTIVGDPVKNVTANKARWGLVATKGSHILEFTYKERTHHKKVLITNERSTEDVLTPIGEDGLVSIETEQPKLIVLNLLGWKLGWLGSYIIFSIAFSMILRKAMKVY
ncbi:DUF106 domain-containing protein [Candidatus Woesearchaeota archaeon]|nr:DUF106 domain-containing protein [Candidatus Woesearchaeota archaeon]